MRIAIIIVALLVTYSLADDGLFASWAAVHGKQYADKAEAALRRSIFLANKAIVDTHNADPDKTFTMELNEFGDLGNEEFAAIYASGLLPDDDEPRNVNTSLLVPSPNNPSSKDWEAEGKVTPVKNQADCGSCWAFAAAGVVEGAFAIKSKGGAVPLSTQQQVDCSGSFGNMGCQGGLALWSLQWIQKNDGLCLNTDYPYQARERPCNTHCKPVARISKIYEVPAKSDTAMINALNINPVAVSIQADQDSFQFYKSGVMTGKCGTSLGHAVLAVGYGKMGNHEYYKIKNSWSIRWGDKGYILLAKGSQYNNGAGQCGMLTRPVYAKA